MNRTQRRKAARNATCSLCHDAMTQQDRMQHKLGLAHPKCVAKAAQARATAAESTVARLKSAAETIQTANRAQQMGLWLPS